MIRPNRPYFLVRIDKKAQTELRNFISIKSCGYLGVWADENLSTKKGCVVEKLDPKGPAADAGFQIGDIIVSINGKKVFNIDGIIQITTSLNAGEEVTIKYLSRIAGVGDGATVYSKQVKLGEKQVKFHLSNFKEMDYNLQYGQIVEVGEKVSLELPEAAIGDILLFHHNVEYKERAEGDVTYNDWHLQKTEANGDELRIVKESELFGVMKFENGKARIVPHKNYVFCHPDVKSSEFQKKNGIWIPESWDKSIQDFEVQLEKLSAEVAEIATSSSLKGRVNDKNYRRREELKKRIEEINKERAELTRLMNQKRLVQATVVFYNPASSEILGQDLQAGDVILGDLRMFYPLQFGGINYILARTKYVEAIINDKNPFMEEVLKKTPKSKGALKPLRDRVFVIPHDTTKMTEGGIIIPDTAQERPNTGVVAFIGPGTSLEKTSLKVGDHVLFSKNSGYKIEWEGKTYLMMVEEEIFSSYDPEEAE